jgi:VanZ family protein
LNLIDAHFFALQYFSFFIFHFSFKTGYNANSKLAMGIYTVLPDGLSEVDVIIAGGTDSRNQPMFGATK